MVLARILAPEAFGVIATITMIVSFMDIFTDAGFQKYLVQKEFKNDDEKYKSANVAFWTNFLLSLILWGLISILSNNIAELLGNIELGIVLIIACAQLPLTSFSSIQMALFRREFNFKTLFLVRLVTMFIPFFVTIPLAILGYSYWSLIIGMISMQVMNAILLTIKSPWKPSFYFDFSLLRQMINFSIWTMIESIAIWFTLWIDTFIIAMYLNEYYLGIYRTSTMMVNSILSLFTAATIPILFSALSRLQNDDDKFNNVFFKFQRVGSLIVLPIGMMIFLYSDFITYILLGNQWSEANRIIGIWALTGSIMIIFGHFCSEVYRSKGMPKLSFIAQVLHLLVLVPTCIIAGKYGFWTLVLFRSLIRFQLIIVHLVIMKKIIGISIIETIKNVAPFFISTLLMGMVGYSLTRIDYGFLWDISSLIICCFVYISSLFIFPKVRMDIKRLMSNKLTLIEMRESKR